jgi:hypothetical protein
MKKKCQCGAATQLILYLLLKKWLYNEARSHCLSQKYWLWRGDKTIVCSSNPQKSWWLMSCLYYRLMTWLIKWKYSEMIYSLKRNLFYEVIWYDQMIYSMYITNQWNNNRTRSGQRWPAKKRKTSRSLQLPVMAGGSWLSASVSSALASMASAKMAGYWPAETAAKSNNHGCQWRLSKISASKAGDG